MFTVNFEDGRTISSKKQYWTDLPKDSLISAVQLTHPHIPKLYICLADLDRYYYSQEAVAFMQSKTPSVVAEIIGGHDLNLGVGIEVRLSYTGNVVVRAYPLDKFKFSHEILRVGLGTAKGLQPKVDIVSGNGESISA